MGEIPRPRERALSPTTLLHPSGSFWKAFTSAAAKLKRTIEHLKKAQDCIPPCGVQEAARRFHCWGCFSTICDLPLDCPGPDSGRFLLP
ncbi:rCG23009, isoform CRA_c [Rattus norvegicus]|uniref:RCG23009, isoform CRA_c n=1 Tax=Rattus norvegicus TaxID=10116 RepID=A6KB71_RAT|nr:rCG23009, isoform CRA_c [Rattus norvegicus]